MHHSWSTYIGRLHTDSNMTTHAFYCLIKSKKCFIWRKRKDTQTIIKLHLKAKTASKTSTYDQCKSFYLASSHISLYILYYAFKFVKTYNTINIYFYNVIPMKKRFNKIDDITFLQIINIYWNAFRINNIAVSSLHKQVFTVNKMTKLDFMF